MKEKKEKKILSFSIEKDLHDKFKEYVKKTCGNVSWLVEKLIINEMNDKDKK